MNALNKDKMIIKKVICQADVQNDTEKKKTIDSALSYVHFKFIKCIHASLLIKNLLALQTK